MSDNKLNYGYMDKLEYRITFRVDEETKKKLDELAEKAHLRLSDYLRVLVLDHIDIMEEDK